jgi:dihydroorotase
MTLPVPIQLSPDPDQQRITAPTFPPFDIVLKRGRVLDPDSGLDAVRDIALAHGRVAAIEEELDGAQARQVLEVRGQLVTPGLVDIHTHIYMGVTPLSVPVDEFCLSTGVTTAVSAGDAGAATFEGFYEHVVRRARTRVYGLCHIARIGLAAWPVGEMRDPAMADPKGAAQVVREYRDVCIGIKVRETTFIVGNNGLEPLRKAVAAAEQSGTRVMVHVYDIPAPLPELLALLRPGDIVTHCYVGSANGILDDNGKLLPEVIEARKRGVLFDVGHGSKLGFSLPVARAALEQGFPPDTISSDMHTQSVNGSMKNLPTVLSKFMNLGLSLREVLERATSVPGRLIDREPGLGRLYLGGPGDVSVFDLIEDEFVVEDDMGHKAPGQYRLQPVHTIRAGHMVGAPYMHPHI